MWKQKESLYKTMRRKAVILMKITQLRTDERTGGCKIVSHVDKLINVLTIFVKPSFHMSGKSQTIGDSTVSRPSQILPRYREI